MEPTRALAARIFLLAVMASPLGACSIGGPAASPSPTPPSVACAGVQSQLKTPGVLTFSTTDPSYGPYFEDDPSIRYLIEPTDQPNWQNTDPYSMHGFEAGVAYSLSNVMGFQPDQVRWVPNTRDAATAAGAKNFDAFIAQMPIPSGGSPNVDYSDSYLDATQAVVAQPTDAITGVKTTADLQNYKLGYVSGTLSESLISQVVKPKTPATGYTDEIGAVAALKSGEIDGFVADIATAFFQINGPDGVDPPLPGGVVFGKFSPDVWDNQYGLVVEKGDPIVSCLNSAIAAIKANLSLQEFAAEDIPVGANVPTFN
jgi:polar amino acid transport system substrate-binding protein